jgi:hypothetical protein
VIAFNAGGRSAASNTANVSTPSDATSGPRVTGFTLIDADTQAVIGVLRDGDVIDRAALGTTEFNIRADVAGTVKSVLFGFNGDDSYRTENEAPWALFGDVDGEYRSWSPVPGFYTITATAFSLTRADGEPGGSVTITFRVI